MGKEHITPKIRPRPAEAYVEAHAFLQHLHGHQYRLTLEQIRDLRARALSGDVDGAMKALGMILLKDEFDDRGERRRDRD